jgi:hypothetical protein
VRLDLTCPEDPSITVCRKVDIQFHKTDVTCANTALAKDKRQHGRQLSEGVSGCPCLHPAADSSAACASHALPTAAAAAPQSGAVLLPVDALLLLLLLQLPLLVHCAAGVAAAAAAAD